jgi:hypothetical protein
MSLEGQPPNCLKCRHFHVSWDPKFPRACRVFGVKSRDLPSRAVYSATGRHCPAFERSPRIRDGQFPSKPPFGYL